jgi:uncharacterized membrane protein
VSAGRPFREELPEALELWQRQGLVSQGQARRILAHYGLAPQTVEEAGGRGRLAAIVAILGAVLVGIGVILFVGSNWQHLDRYQRVGLLLAAMLAAYAGGYWLNYRPGNYPRIGASLIFLGTVVFGANLFLVAQMYHVSANEPMLLALWSAGALAMAYAAVSRPSLYLGILVAVAWYGFQLAAWHVERLGASSLIGLAAFVSYGLLLVAVGEVQRSFRQTGSFSTPFVRLGLAVTLAAIWLFSFADVWRAIASMAAGPATPEVLGPALDYLIASFVLFSVAAVVLAAWGFRRQGIDRTSVFEGVGVAVLLLSSLLVVFHPLSEAAHYALVFNVVLLAAVVWAIVLGVWSRREALINIGLAFFVLLVVARYFDFFFSFMDRSLAFIAGGLLLMGGGYLLERSRRRLLLSMRVEEA